MNVKGLSLAVFTMLLASVQQLSAYTETVDGIEWTYDVKNGEAYLIDPSIPKSTAGAITIPDHLGGYPVKRLMRFAFCNRSRLESVSIPEGVTSIGSGAFYGCTKLVSVTIPNSVESIGEEAFLLCSFLRSVTIPDSVMEVGESAFRFCRHLESVSIPSRFEGKTAKWELPEGCKIIARTPTAATRKADKMVEAKEHYKQGLRYINGDGVLKSDKKGFEFIREAAEMGYPDACATLALCYYQGIGCTQDKALCFEFAKKVESCEGTYCAGMAKELLGGLFFFGFNDVKGTFRQDFDKAYVYSKGAYHKKPDDLVGFRIGLMEYHGVGTERNAEAAAESFYSVCKTKHSTKHTGMAAMCLGQLYFRGEGVERNPAEAWKWLRFGVKAAFPDLVREAKKPLSREDVVAFNRSGPMISFTPFSWKMHRLYSGRGVYKVNGVKFDLLEKALTTLFNPDLWQYEQHGVNYTFDDL